MTSNPLEPASKPADQVIEEEWPCAGCGYNLRGLSPGARCPECGHSIRQSLTFRYLRDVDLQWLKGLRRGLLLCALVPAIRLLLDAAGLLYLLQLLGWSSYQRMESPSNIILVSIFELLAAWSATRTPRNTPLSRRYPTGRIRAAWAVCTVATVFSLLVRHSSWQLNLTLVLAYLLSLGMLFFFFRLIARDLPAATPQWMISILLWLGLPTLAAVDLSYFMLYAAQAGTSTWLTRIFYAHLFCSIVTAAWSLAIVWRLRSEVSRAISGRSLTSKTT